MKAQSNAVLYQRLFVVEQHGGVAYDDGGSHAAYCYIDEQEDAVNHHGNVLPVLLHLKQKSVLASLNATRGTDRVVTQHASR